MPRRNRRERRVVTGIEQLPFSVPATPYKSTEVLDESQIDEILAGAYQVLETYGMRFLDDESRATLRTEGADVDDDTLMVRFGRDMVEEKIRRTDAEFIGCQDTESPAT